MKALTLLAVSLFLMNSPVFAVTSNIEGAFSGVPEKAPAEVATHVENRGNNLATHAHDHMAEHPLTANPRDPMIEYALDDQGQVIRDEHGNPLTLTEMVDFVLTPLKGLGQGPKIMPDKNFKPTKELQTSEEFSPYYRAPRKDIPFVDDTVRAVGTVIRGAGFVFKQALEVFATPFVDR